MGQMPNALRAPTGQQATAAARAHETTGTTPWHVRDVDWVAKGIKPVA